MELQPQTILLKRSLNGFIITKTPNIWLAKNMNAFQNSFGLLRNSTRTGRVYGSRFIAGLVTREHIRNEGIEKRGECKKKQAIRVSWTTIKSFIQ